MEMNFLGEDVKMTKTGKQFFGTCLTPKIGENVIEQLVEEGIQMSGPPTRKEEFNNEQMRPWIRVDAVMVDNVDMWKISGHVDRVGRVKMGEGVGDQHAAGGR